MNYALYKIDQVVCFLAPSALTPCNSVDSSRISIKETKINMAALDT